MCKVLLMLAVLTAPAFGAWGVFRGRTVVRYRGTVSACPNGQCQPVKPEIQEKRGDGTWPLSGDGSLPLKELTEAQKWANYKVKIIVRRGGLFHPRGWGGRFEGVGSCSGGQIPTCTPCGDKWCEGCRTCGKPRGDAKAYSVRTRQWYRVRIW